MTDLPESLRHKLKSKFHITHPVMLDSRTSAADGTTKYLLKMEDASTIETVFLPEKERATICLSTQVGCKFACSFCASAPFGFVRDLKASEILDEVLFVKSVNPAVPVTNLVFMGIGEPLDNYDNVLKAVRIFNDPDAFGIGARKITISTCGIIPGIKRMEKEGLQVELSVSLHSADDGVRSKLVPVNKRYPIKELIASCREYIERTDRVITFEYILIKGANASLSDAMKLARLLRGMKCKVNTITYNKIRIKEYTEPSSAEARAFLKILKDNGIKATHRKSKGEDIDAGCGQLRISRL
jgi:23S rRNA (adenine2503-C2)-methyltransferase